MAAHVKAEDELMIMSTEELLQAQLELYHHCFAFVKSMALKAATDLRIPDAIQRRGGAATLSDLAADTGIHPSKVAHLPADHARANQLWQRLHNPTQRRTRWCRRLQAHPGLPPPRRKLTSQCFSNGGRARPPVRRHVSAKRTQLVHRRAGGGRLALRGGTWLHVVDVLLREGSGVFQGVGSLVDVGGGHGAVAAAVAAAFPHIKCTVLERPNVVAGAPADVGNVEFVVGDMFEYIPPADALLFKWIFHDWQDEDCVKILRQCKKAIPSRDARGKVIIIDTVVECGSHVTVSKETQLWLDVFMMHVDGIERDELEWRKIFFEAGFSDYKITPVSGFLRSIIEVYP